MANLRSQHIIDFIVPHQFISFSTSIISFKMSKRYSIEDRVWLVMEYAKCNGNVKAVQRSWQHEHHTRDHPADETITKLIEKFQQTGSVEDDRSRSGRPSTVCRI